MGHGRDSRVLDGRAPLDPVKIHDSALPRYPIRAVSKLTGIGIDTLRAWERRHGAVTPIRDDRGRMYTDADVARLRLLRGAVEHGHSIGRVAGLDEKALRHLTAAAGAATVPAVDPMRQPSQDAAALTAAMRTYDAAGIDQEIARLSAVLRPLDLLRDVLMPVLVEIGDEWHRGRVGVAQEHLMSSAIRHILGSLLRLHSRRDVPARLLFTTPSGDRHEIGTLGAAVLAAMSGLGVAYLGPDLPARDIVGSVKPANAQVLVLGLTTTSAKKTTARELRAIVHGLPRDVELWVGGRGASRYGSIITPRGLVFGNYTAYQQELVRMGGRVA